MIVVLLCFIIFYVVVRTVEQFYKMFLIDTLKRKAIQLCPFVNSGLMHRHFQPHLKPNGQGIDYSVPEMVNFDLVPILNKKLKELGRPLVVI